VEPLYAGTYRCKMPPFLGPMFTIFQNLYRLKQKFWVFSKIKGDGPSKDPNRVPALMEIKGAFRLFCHGVE